MVGLWIGVVFAAALPLRMLVSLCVCLHSFIVSRYLSLSPFVFFHVAFHPEIWTFRFCRTLFASNSESSFGKETPAAVMAFHGKYTASKKPDFSMVNNNFIYFYLI